MAHIALLRLLPRYAFFWFIATFVVILPLTTCGAISGHTDPPLDTVCGEATTLSSNVDHRYLSSITMQNETTGWGQNYVQKGGIPSGVPTAEQTILHTTDGGCHWKIVKSWKYSMEPSPDFYPFFFSASQALVYVNGVFSLTRDSGVTWSSITLPIATGQKLFPKQVFFLDDQHGWISASVTSGQSVQNDALLRTTDGGLSWTQMHTTFPAVSDGRIEHLYFLNETTGWITGISLPNDKQPQEHHWIYITHDGGLSWHEQHLPDPQGYRTSSLLELGSPRFFSTKDGILPAASTHYAPTGTCAFITHDGGQSWQSMPFFAIEDYTGKVVNPDNLPGPQITVYILVPVPYFTSLTTGWAGTSYVYRTTDGGRSWHYFDQQLPVHYSDLGLRFVTDHVALALASTGSATDFQSPTELYKTTNGGKTWTTVRYTVS